ncbi:MAG: S9 family peptidase [Alistipes sp.]|nr:S9 family peptidase [Alistipes sp.]MDE7129096.1 S9 family peptidase [Alistipes sp.]
MKRLYLFLLGAALAGSASAQVGYVDMLRMRSAQSIPVLQSPAAMMPTSDADRYCVVTDHAVVSYDYATGERCDTLLRIGDDRSILSVEFSSDMQMLLMEARLNGAASPRRAIYRHSYTSDYDLLAADGRSLARFEGVRDVSFSPDSRMLAYARDNNLYLYDMASAATVAVTGDGEWNNIINATTDWVYEEEYGFTRAYAFSPDSHSIAFLRFDESRVPLFEMMRFDGELYNHAYRFKYPKAGDCNSVVELHLYDIASGTTQRIDTGVETDQYIPHIGWTPAGELYFYRVNRKQNLFEVIVCHADGVQQTIYREQSPRYVERPDPSTVTFVDADRFIVREETTAGWFHLYLYSIKRGRIRALTAGEWEVTGIVGIDAERGGRVYYMSTERSPLRRNLYRVDMNGRNKCCLGDDDFYWTVYPSPQMKYFAATRSSAARAPMSAIYDADGLMQRSLSAMVKRKAGADKLPVQEFTTFTTERGDELNIYIMRPRDFDPSRRYPVLLTQYSGPGSQQVADRWGGDWEQTLAMNGYIVACCDGRGTGFRGEEFKKQTYGDLGRAEVEDQLSFARYMASLPYVDSSRIGIYGWSYGGFMALGCALKCDGLFRMAIAVAPVTSWRYYDSIYTEIYNDLPQDNPEGYDLNSPINFADRLSDDTRLLIIHGTADDNVHFQNSMEMCRALNRAGKQYDMMVYPDQNHSMMPDDRINIREKMVEYCLENL